jgi:hypothetical protein
VSQVTGFLPVSFYHQTCLPIAREILTTARHDRTGRIGSFPPSGPLNRVRGRRGGWFRKEPDRTFRLYGGCVDEVKVRRSHSPDCSGCGPRWRLCSPLRPRMRKSRSATCKCCPRASSSSSRRVRKDGNQSKATPVWFTVSGRRQRDPHLDRPR